MLDTKSIEEFGIPSVFLASGEFVTAVEARARALGFDSTPICTEHPIQDRADAEMVAIADSVLDETVAKWTEQGRA